ncbi:MAG TPA: histidine kinase [Caldimonas sp.]|nr:histidine kinase [Caldimonas sp.]
MHDEPAPSATARRDDAGLWRGYLGLCLLCWLLYAMAATEWQRGGWRLIDGLYEASWNLLPPMLLGAAALPWVRWLHRRQGSAGAWIAPALHLAAIAVFVALWEFVDFAAARAFFGLDHAVATFHQRVLWRAVWGVFIYLALVFGFGGALHSRRAQRAALQAARAEAALVRSELAAISGKLNPHFLFNTLNSLLMLIRKDASAAEDALLCFSRMMRYVLDKTRGAADRVPLQDELDFLHDYLALEALRLGPRLRVDWQIDPATVADAIPPLTLQPLVENSIVHGIAPQRQGGTVRIVAARVAGSTDLELRVADDGAGCVWPPAVEATRGRGIGLGALRRRFQLDFDGRAHFEVRSAPGAGFHVEIRVPQPA